MIRPEEITMIRPASVQSMVSLSSCEVFWWVIPTPRRRRSTMEIVPIESANAAMWKHSTSGKDHSLLLSGFVAGSYASTALIYQNTDRNRCPDWQLTVSNRLVTGVSEQ